MGGGRPSGQSRRTAGDPGRKTLLASYGMHSTVYSILKHVLKVVLHIQFSNILVWSVPSMYIYLYRLYASDSSFR